jgi:hypothetical protein
MSLQPGCIENRRIAGLECRQIVVDVLPQRWIVEDIDVERQRRRHMRRYVRNYVRRHVHCAE